MRSLMNRHRRPCLRMSPSMAYLLSSVCLVLALEARPARGAVAADGKPEQQSTNSQQRAQQNPPPQQKTAPQTPAPQAPAPQQPPPQQQQPRPQQPNPFENVPTAPEKPTAPSIPRSMPLSSVNPCGNAKAELAAASPLSWGTSRLHRGRQTTSVNWPLYLNKRTPNKPRLIAGVINCEAFDGEWPGSASLLAAGREKERGRCDHP
jgi:hypothetical protein